MDWTPANTFQSQALQSFFCNVFWEIFTFQNIPSVKLNLVNLLQVLLVQYIFISIDYEITLLLTLCTAKIKAGRQLQFGGSCSHWNVFAIKCICHMSGLTYVFIKVIINSDLEK